MKSISISVGSYTFTLQIGRGLVDVSLEKQRGKQYRKIFAFRVNGFRLTLYAGLMSLAHDVFVAFQHFVH